MLHRVLMLVDTADTERVGLMVAVVVIAPLHPARLRRPAAFSDHPIELF